ncbi:hypothetical protein [Haliscomenobacter hydrossis]|uniref:hypothetical protein n=1 Tax=Haliscomenobacter hydrossis TaxID=2350 RepID=UPI0011D1BC8F|nr:hypothetical protein [Haliscomenobacter hydrossis]
MNFGYAKMFFSPRRHDDTTFCSAPHDASVVFFEARSAKNVVSSCRRGEKNKQLSCAKALSLELIDPADDRGYSKFNAFAVRPFIKSG